MEREKHEVLLRNATEHYQSVNNQAGILLIDLKGRIREAAADGVPKTKIAEVTDMSRQAVYDILDGGERRRQAAKAKR